MHAATAPGLLLYLLYSVVVLIVVVRVVRCMRGRLILFITARAAYLRWISYKNKNLCSCEDWNWKVLTHHKRDAYLSWHCYR